jgi:hypothetical protein
MTLGDHGKVNQQHPMVLLPGRGGIQTINGKNIMNSLYWGPAAAYDFASLGAFLKVNGYSGFDFKCLHIKKRRLVLETLAKTINYIKKRKLRRK